MLEQNDTLTSLPPILLNPCAAQSKLLSHETTMESCMKDITSITAKSQTPFWIHQKDFGMTEVSLTCQTASIFFPTNSSHRQQKEGFTAYCGFKTNPSKIEQMMVTPPVLAVKDRLKSEQMFQVSVLEQRCCNVITKGTRESLSMNLHPLHLEFLL